MVNNTSIACVTGGSGMIGRRIVQRLMRSGYRIRVLSRSQSFDASQVDLVRGALDNEDTLRQFVFGAHLLFHCAAELHDESKMWEVNVLGTERLLNVVKGSNIQYLCHLSSAGVVGRTNKKWVDERSECNPQNAYERSKWTAERLIDQRIDGCRIVILRPTNVIDEKRPGALGLPMRGSLLDLIKVFVKGGECAHIVHAENVAAAAMHFVRHPIESSRCFFVSCDHEPLNTFAGLWALYKALEKNQPTENVRPGAHLPVMIPHILRKIWRGTGNRGDVRYSSDQLLSEGFKFPFGLTETVKSVISAFSDNGDENIKC